MHDHVNSNIRTYARHSAHLHKKSPIPVIPSCENVERLYCCAYDLTMVVNIESHNIELSFCNSDDDSCSNQEHNSSIGDISHVEEEFSHCSQPRIVLYSTSTPVSLRQKTAIRRLTQLLDVLNISFSRDNQSCSLEYEVRRLKCRCT